MIAKIISGGQTGVDAAALRAARAAGVATGGYAPLGWSTEDGPNPGLADFGLTECPVADYPARTRLNVAAADALLWLGNPRSPGGRLTLRLSKAKGIDDQVVLFGTDYTAWTTAWLRTLPDGSTLLVAGNRESSCPGIGAWAEAFLGRVLLALRALREGRP